LAASSSSDSKSGTWRRLSMVICVKVLLTRGGADSKRARN
jgi:hypothetical protein